MNSNSVEHSDYALSFDARNQWLWQRMADRVADGRFDVVVLVARKMPRLAEVFNLSFGGEALIISDNAIPFCCEEIRGARVAVVDDMLNVGSTVDKIGRDLHACGAVSVEIFTLCRKRASTIQGRINTVAGSEINDEEYARHVVKVPLLISKLTKPYDLAFPVIRGTFAAPYASASEILGRLEELYRGQISILPSPYYNSRAKRVSIIQPESSACGDRIEHAKIRLYFDDESKTCIVVPMAIPAELNEATLEVEHSLPVAVKSHLISILRKRCSNVELTEVGELTVNLYVHALNWLLTSPFCQKLADVLTLNLTDSFRGSDCEMIFGDAFRSFSLDSHQLEEFPSCAHKGIQGEYRSSGSPFYYGAREKLLNRAIVKFLELCPIRPSEGFDCFSCVKAIIEALAELVGAEAPEEYELDFPHSREAVQAEPYLRLKIGPTFQDMLLLVSELLEMSGFESQPPESLYYALSVVIDMTVDNGGLVPTVARYENRSFRIYRKGENSLWDKSCHRVQWAVAQAAEEKNITFSVQRLTKLLSALSFSSAYGQLLEPQVATRGFIASLPESVLDENDTAIAYYMLKTGKLKVPQLDQNDT